MLNVIYQISKAAKDKEVIEDCRFYFSRKKKEEWFQDPFVQAVIKKVDKAEVVSGMILKDRDGQIIPPDYLSTGTKLQFVFTSFQM